MSHIASVTTIEIPIRELHARTGHFVRKASADVRVIITDRGKPVAQLQALGNKDGEASRRPTWGKRALLPGYAALMNKPVGGTDSCVMISEDRDR